MKVLLFLCTLLMSLNASAVWDMLLKANPDRAYMNFFYKGYKPWFEKTFNKSLEFPGPNGKEFFTDALMQLDHWTVKDHPHFDQLLIGQSFEEGRATYSLSIYLHPEVRNHPFIKSQKLSFSPDFAGWNGKELCFAKFISTDEVEHFCKNRKIVSKFSAKESKTFKNPFEGLIEWEITFTQDGKVIRTFHFTKNLHMSFIPKEFYPYIMEHGSATHMPLDKYSLEEGGKMTVYYP